MSEIKADISLASDRGENLSLMMPLLISEGSSHRKDLTDMAMDLAARASGLRCSVPEGIRSELANLVRAMNCYYSNLIEGHHTHPIDIERALNSDYSRNPQQRNLQLEAKAHISVQEWLDSGAVTGRAVSVNTIREIHRRFYELLPDDLRRVTNPDTGEQVEIAPGELRSRDTRVGQHISISPGAVSRFLAEFETRLRRLGKTETILAIPSAHHRLLWIHPFLDGNGRMARLMSHASLLETLDTGGIWSVARGLARNVGNYKDHLAQCDLQRRNDLDGRGNLSEESLVSFSRFFLETCLDQIRFMREVLEPERLRTRILLWAEEETRLGELPPKSGNVLAAVLYRGELPRGEVAQAVSTGERQARRIISILIRKGVLTAASARSPLRLAFPARLAARWLPGLFPEK
jgi:Fic family protein